MSRSLCAPCFLVPPGLHYGPSRSPKLYAPHMPVPATPVPGTPMSISGLPPLRASPHLHPARASASLGISFAPPRSARSTGSVCMPHCTTLPPANYTCPCHACVPTCIIASSTVRRTDGRLLPLPSPLSLLLVPGFGVHHASVLPFSTSSFLRAYSPTHSLSRIAGLHTRIWFFDTTYGHGYVTSRPATQYCTPA